MPSFFTESAVEKAALEWFEELGYEVVYGPDIAPGEAGAERGGFGEVVLAGRLRGALERLNPGVGGEALEDAFRRLVVSESPSLVGRNRQVHRMLVEGVEVEMMRGDGTVAGVPLAVLDFDDVDANDWLVVNQFTVDGGEGRVRRPDVVVFVNGLPLVVIELKNAASETADVWKAYAQLQTYKAQIPALFEFNEALVVSDGLDARMGTLTASREWFMPWRTIEGQELAPAAMPQLEVMIRGVFDKGRFLELVQGFVVFDDDGRGGIAKKMAGYHQFHAVRVAVEETVRATTRTALGKDGASRAADGDGDGGVYRSAGRKKGKPGDRQVGVVWHTQGSGKSLTMAFYAGRVMLHKAMENPTLVVITDRNDLDDQLFGTFAQCEGLLPEHPQQALDRGNLRELLKVDVGGIVFTTIQKFMPGYKGDAYPLLSDRRNIVVIADEAHRSQYDFIDGFARHMRDALPFASFVGFTGTPIELSDKNTRAVFGDYISVYDIKRAVEDGATVPIYYESRLARLELDEAERPRLDEEFEEVTEGEEVEQKEKLKTKWAAVEALVGTQKRLNLVARDIVEHFEARQEALDGKAMVVCMSRRICVDLFEAIVKLRPQWRGVGATEGAIKVVMTGDAMDPVHWQEHVGNKLSREALAKRFKKPEDPLKMVLVRDMWLTGFDVPCLHTMYVDKPMRGHGLMQAIARVNRVYKDKPGGLIVDYLGLAAELKKALHNYTESGGTGRTQLDQGEAALVMLAKYELCCDLLHGLDWSAWIGGDGGAQLNLLAAGQEHVLAQEDGRRRFMQHVVELSKAFALAVPHDDAIRVRDDVGFFQAVRVALAKSGREGRPTGEELDQAIRQLVSRAVSSNEVVDIFAAAGLNKPNLSILSDEFLEEVRELPHKNLAVETLRKLLAGEIKLRTRTNVVQSRSFTEMLEQSIRRYQNRAIEAVQVIEELIELARELRDAVGRGENLGLNDDEVAFYDALEVNDSAVQVLGDATLKDIARELVETVRSNVSIDWAVKETARAKLRVLVKRILRKYGYPPDKQEKAVQTVLEQAEVLCGDWAVA
jgi:type I restriction enzyme R subunit